MLDIKFIRKNKDQVEKMLAKRQIEVDLDHLLEIDDTRIKLIQEVEELHRERKLAAEKKNIEKGKEIKESLRRKEDGLASVEGEFKEWLYRVPNLLMPDIPTGDASKNQILKKVGDPAKFDFTPKDHLELGERLNIIDVARGAKVSGSRFAYLKGDGALLELALIRLAFDRLTKEGFTPVFPPALIKQDITKGLGYWQAGGNENYYLVSDYNVDEKAESETNPLYLIGTAEHVLVPMHSGETFTASQLPLKYAGFSPSFRREAGSYGKDNRGILRVHQFDKVEMVSFVLPQEDESQRAAMLELAQDLLKELELPYQTVKLASADLSFPAAETIDIETWIPSQGTYRETHSISTTTDFQARRLNIKYGNGKETGFVHILNGTAFAIGRTIIAILENHQQKDGSVKLPKALHDYLGKDTLSR
jgi:seryl-tRNA synthetase